MLLSFNSNLTKIFSNNILRHYCAENFYATNFMGTYSNILSKDSYIFYDLILINLPLEYSVYYFTKYFVNAVVGKHYY